MGNSGGCSRAIGVPHGGFSGVPLMERHAADAAIASSAVVQCNAYGIANTVSEPPNSV
jgi:hypothetical protein